MRQFLTVFGPGFVVMLADTDVGSIITAGQSGAQWGYRLLPVQLLLIPVLYIAQELTVRLGVFTRRGYGALLCDTFGRGWGWVSVAALAVAVAGALLSELSGVAAVGDLYGVPRIVSLPLAVVCLLGVVLTGGYRRAERIAVVVGLFEFAFFLVAWQARPAWGELAAQAGALPLGDPAFRYMAAANIGTAVTPWMIFYQQAAIAARRLTPAHLPAARADTAIGAVVAQAVMAAVLMACAASLAGRPSVGSVGDLAAALQPVLGQIAGTLVFSLGILGAGMVAAIVATLALAHGIVEVGRVRAPALYAAVVIGCAGVVAVVPDLVALNIGVQAVNALLLPLVAGMLVAVSVRALPPGVRPGGWYLAVVIAVLGAAALCGVAGVL